MAIPGTTGRNTDNDNDTGAREAPFNPQNDFDAWVLDKNGFRTDANAEVKAVYGLPASGPGPGKQGANPRSGQLECAGD